MSEEENKKENNDSGPPTDNQITEIDKLKQDLENALKEKDEYLNGWKRAKADLINYKKEDSKRFEEVALYSQQRLIGELLSILDSFDLALASVADEGSKRGILMIKGQMEEVLKRQGLERIQVKAGDELDMTIHEPIDEQELDPNAVGAISAGGPELREGKQSGTIASELVAGYKLNNKIIRPAKVKIYK